MNSLAQPVRHRAGPPEKLADARARELRQEAERLSEARSRPTRPAVGRQARLPYRRLLFVKRPTPLSLLQFGTPQEDR
jgi:hypothetical protein